MPKKIRVGIAGAGFIGAVHARAYLQVPDIELVGIAEDDMDGAAAMRIDRSIDAPKF